MNRCVRNNNPGNIKSSEWTENLFGYKGKDKDGFAVFRSWHFGLIALIRLLKGGAYSYLSINSALEKCAPKSENDTKKYIKFIRDFTELEMETEIKDLGMTEFMKLCEAISIYEGWPKGVKKWERAINFQSMTKQKSFWSYWL